MTEPRDPSRIDPEDDPEPSRPVGPTSSRRFARLIESPAARKLALPRLIAALVIALVLIAVAGLVVIEVGGSTHRWLASRPEYRLPFSRIELDPEPDPWIKGGKARILEQVRTEAKHLEDLSLLSLDRKALRDDFQRCPWVREASVRVAYGRLIVHLRYRKPVAVVAVKGEKGYVIDEEGIPLPPDDIDWTAEAPARCRVRGISDPLIEVRGIELTITPRIGVPWKRPEAGNALEGPDLRVLGAARLAEFLQNQPKTSTTGRAVPDFVSIWPKESNRVFLRDAGLHDLYWENTPGNEKPGERTALEKWKTLLEWVDRHGPLEAKLPNYYQFSSTGLELITQKSPK